MNARLCTLTLVAAACSAGFAASSRTAHAQTGFSITGALSNFDCTNRCDYPCDEMEIEVEGAEPSEIIHTYTNGNYGPPTVTLAANGTSTIVDYRNPQHLTAVNSIEHFGVTIRGAVYYGPPAVYHPIHVRWYRSGHIATVNGQVPNPEGGTAPATQPMLPSIAVVLNPGVPGGPHSAGGATLTVTNNDPGQSIWIKRRAQITTGTVTLEALMPTDPVVTTSVVIDTSPVRLLPSQTLTLSNDLIEIEDEQSVVFSAEYFQNLTAADPFSPNVPGAMLGNIMTAAIASPHQMDCPHGPPVVVTQPENITQAASSRVDIHINAHGDDVTPITYQWLKDGVALTDGNGVSGTTTSHLRIDHLAAANEGFYSVRLTNFCATTLSNSALVFITGHNVAPTHLVFCPADFNQIGGVTVQDIFDYLNAWFSGNASADINGGGLAVQDIFDFLNIWFSGC
jgi:hypothetical protein